MFTFRWAEGFLYQLNPKPKLYSILIKFPWSSWWVLSLGFPSTVPFPKCSVSMFILFLLLFLICAFSQKSDQPSVLSTNISDSNNVHILDWRMLTPELTGARRAHKQPVTTRMIFIKWYLNIEHRTWQRFKRQISSVLM